MSTTQPPIVKIVKRFRAHADGRLESTNEVQAIIEHPEATADGRVDWKRTCQLLADAQVAERAQAAQEVKFIKTLLAEEQITYGELVRQAEALTDFIRTQRDTAYDTIAHLRRPWYIKLWEFMR